MAKVAWRIFLYILIFLLVGMELAWCQCEYGTYKVDGRHCCLCAPGQNVKEDCTKNGTVGKCVICGDETYKSVPSRTQCKKCTSCTQPNANLEEDTPCIHTADRTCRCKNDHYCPGATGGCIVCQPCTKCDVEGIKHPCTKNNDTVCNEKVEGASHVGRVVGAVFGFLLIAGAIGIIVCLLLRNKYKDRRPNGPNPEENKPMNQDHPKPIPDDIDLQHHVPALVKVIGWTDMHTIALRSGIQKTDIENCQLEHPSDFNEKTIALLNIWIEKQGRGAGNKLRQILLDMEKTRKAQQVERILLQDGSNNSPV